MIMKKFFTLIAVALCALTASAKETIPNFTPSTMTFGYWIRLLFILWRIAE